MIDVDVNDIRTLKKFDVKLNHNPASNMFLAAGGIAPVVEYINAGLSVGLGTDDPNANQSVNLIAEMKFAALVQSHKYGPSAMTPEKVLEMSTIDGARCVGLDREVGSIETGKKADMVLLDLRRAHTTPAHSIASTIVYQALGGEVDTVIVDGRILLEGGELACMSAEEEMAFLASAQQASSDVLQRAGMADMRDRAWTSSA
jgi:cytosine/adenosine deaminase-related metal-dependent hydrolase